MTLELKNAQCIHIPYSMSCCNQIRQLSFPPSLNRGTNRVYDISKYHVRLITPCRTLCSKENDKSVNNKSGNTNCFSDDNLRLIEEVSVCVWGEVGRIFIMKTTLMFHVKMKDYWL